MARGPLVRGWYLLSTITISAHIGFWGRGPGGLGIDDEWAGFNRLRETSPGKGIFDKEQA